MSSKETRFSYVYKSLKCRITEGLLLPGSRLPSSRVLKDEYQVSLFTINKVLAALREEGLIELEPRPPEFAAWKMSVPSPLPSKPFYRKKTFCFSYTRPWSLFFPLCSPSLRTDANLKPCPIIGR